MKQILFFVICIALFPLSVGANDVEDTSIIDELEKIETTQLQGDYSLKSFESCSAFEDVMEDYMKSYWKNHYKNGRQYRMFGEPVMMEMSLQESVSDDAVSSKSTDTSDGGDYSQTNTQVAGVDESDIVKTDGEYLYYYNATQQAVYIVNAEDATLQKKLSLPKSFYNIELYVSGDRLVILASGYSQTDYSKRGYYINRNAKTYTIVFDISDVSSPELIQLYSADGDLTKSRRVGDYVYVLSRNYFNFPYWNITDEDDISIDAELLLPKKIDISKTENTGEQNLTLRGKKLPYNVETGNIADCSSISYNFPDEETLKNSSFNPGYTIISIINIRDVEENIETHVVAGSNTEIYMSQDNLYLTEGIWQAQPFHCPIDMICARPFFWGGSQNTLIHKLNFSGNQMSYQDSGLVPGSPLNQYSMDEYEGNFRIITSEWSPERSTGLYILDENLESLSSLTNLAPGENFQSSRFIGEKLFLVTFEQIDPLFAIDVSDPSQPELLGELKIPGFSTYLHPYDDTHLIGLGYDTQVNEWGGVTTAGVKVDLYKINYDKKCGDSNLTAIQEEKCESGDYKGIIVEQLYTETLGGKGSYSEALNNPRMFIWNAERNTLLLPASIYEKDDNWKTLDYYSGVYAINIDHESGIHLDARTTHIDLTGVEEARNNDCAKYSSHDGDAVCRELINGEVHCEDRREYSYVPNYCYKDTTLWQYVGDTSWQYRNMNITRALYIGEKVYAFSDDRIGEYDWSLRETQSVDMK